MAAVALALYLVWVTWAFGWQTIRQHRRTGDTGLRLAARPGTAQWWAKLGFITAMALGLAAPIAALAGLDDIARFDRAWLHAIGIVVAVAGIALTDVAQRAMGAAWRIGVDPDEPTPFVTAGAFGIVRNPIFTAMLVTATGLTMIIPNIVSIIGLAVTIAALELQVRLVEEPYLRELHGDRYREYSATVGRFVPHIGRTPR